MFMSVKIYRYFPVRMGPMVTGKPRNYNVFLTVFLRKVTKFKFIGEPQMSQGQASCGARSQKTTHYMHDFIDL